MLVVGWIWFSGRYFVRFFFGFKGNFSLVSMVFRVILFVFGLFFCFFSDVNFLRIKDCFLVFCNFFYSLSIYCVGFWLFNYVFRREFSFFLRTCLFYLILVFIFYLFFIDFKKQCRRLFYDFGFFVYRGFQSDIEYFF